MPKIAEIKEIDGEIWLRFDKTLMKQGISSISFYTDKELKDLLREERAAFAEAITMAMADLNR